MSQAKKMKLMYIIVFTILITALPVFANDLTFKDTEQLNKNSITPDFTYISSFTSDLNITLNGLANVSVFASARNCDRVVIKGFLQRYELGSWKTISNWSLNQSGTFGLLDEIYSVTKGYQYRLYSSCEIYNQTNLIESESLVTNTVFY